MRGISIEERAISLAQYIINTGDTVRGAAKKFGVSKNTVHIDVGKLQILNIPRFIVLSTGFNNCSETRVKLAVKI